MTVTPSPTSIIRGRILVTGASGALGGALALRRAAPGVQLLLWGRDQTRLNAIAAHCQAKGADVHIRCLDLADITAGLAALVTDDAMPITQALLVAGQGDSVPPGAVVEDAAQVARLVQVNFAAPAALAAKLAGRMVARGSGRILLVGSAAGFHALPFAAGYAGSKAGLARFAEALQMAVEPHGVAITLVSPGFIDWAAGGRPIARLLLLSLDAAADRIMAAFDAGTAHAIIPRRFGALRWLDRLLPIGVRARMLRSMGPH